MASDALLCAHLFLTVASAIVGKAARDAIFLGRFTPLQMAGVDLATMAGVAAVVGLQSRLRARLPVRRVLVFVPLCLAAGDAALWLGLTKDSVVWVAWIVYMWVGVQASLVAPHASVLMGQVLSLRQARQMCGRLGAGAIAGWIGGGLIARFLAPRLGAPSLLLASGLLTALSPLIVVMVWRARRSDSRQCAGSPDRSDDAAQTMPRRRRASLRANAWFVWHSPHLRSMAALAFTSAAATTIAGFQFKAIASRSISGADQLAAMFGSFSFHAGLVALVTQVIVTPRVIGRFGLGSALAVAPAALAAGSVGVLCSGTLAAAMLMKGSDQVLRYSVDRAAIELLYRPLPAPDVFEGKTFIDAIVCRCGDAAGAMMALFAAAVLHIGFPALGVVTIPLILAWLLSARAARHGYNARLLEDLRLEMVSCAEPGRSSRPAFGSKAPAGTAATRRVLDPDPRTRLRVLRALTAGCPRAPRVRGSATVLSTALAAEIVGFAVLVDAVSSTDSLWGDHRDEGLDAIERISRLLFLLSPDRYPGCVASALRSGNAVAEARAQAYLDSTLASPHRQFLMSLLDRWALAAASSAAGTAAPALFTARPANV